MLRLEGIKVGGRKVEKKENTERMPFDLFVSEKSESKTMRNLTS